VQLPRRDPQIYLAAVDLLALPALLGSREQEWAAYFNSSANREARWQRTTYSRSGEIAEENAAVAGPEEGCTCGCIPG